MTSNKAAAAYPITLNDVLDIRYIVKWDWSPDGRQIGLIWDNGGILDLWVVDVDGPGTGPRQISKAKRSVADFGWRPGRPAGRNELAFIQDGNVWLTDAPAESSPAANSGAAGAAGETGETAVSLESDKPRLLIQSEAKHTFLSWSPDGETLAVARDGAVWLLTLCSGTQVQVAVPGKVQGGGRDGRPPLTWSPNGSKLAFTFGDDGRLPVVGVASSDGKLLWRNRSSDPAANPTWVDENTLFFAVSHKTVTEADFYLVDLAKADLAKAASDEAADCLTRILNLTADGQGSLFSLAAWPAPDGQSLLLLLESVGWLHLYQCSRDGSRWRRLTDGYCEDFGHAGDEPAWDSGGRYVAYASNLGSAGERRLWLVDTMSIGVDGRNGPECRPFVVLPGQNTQPRWSPDGKRLAFLHCDAWRAPDLWVLDMDVAAWASAQPALPAVPAHALRFGDPRPGELALSVDLPPVAPRQLTFGMPAVWSEKTVSHPEEVVYKGALDWDIHGYLYKPQDFDPARRYPGIVWVHGGPVRQMRPGFNPMRSYTLFHAFNMYLAQKGYVILEVNYRGGTGYGRAFRAGLIHKMGVDDVVDVVNGGRYLKGLPYVDPEKVAVYGLSYGGYMTLHALGQYPDEFCMGINIAGVYDFAQWTKWIESRNGRHAGGFKVNFGGTPEESPELYRIGSPCTYIANVRRPLINVQGTKDMNVDFAQLDRIVKDCVDLGKEYEAYYYPDEVHTFALKKSWLDAYPKIEREFEKRLKR